MIWQYTLWQTGLWNDEWEGGNQILCFRGKKKKNSYSNVNNNKSRLGAVIGKKKIFMFFSTASNPFNLPSRPAFSKFFSEILFKICICLMNSIFSSDLLCCKNNVQSSGKSLKSLKWCKIKIETLNCKSKITLL